MPRITAAVVLLAALMTGCGGGGEVPEAAHTDIYDALDLEEDAFPSMGDAFDWLDSLPDDMAGQVSALCDYDWQSDEAAAVFGDADSTYDLC